MARTTYFRYAFSNGKIKFLTPEEAEKYSEENNVTILKDGLEEAINAPRQRIRDGFQAGWNPALGQYVQSKSEYKRILKQKGLVEMGYEMPKHQSKRKSNFSDDKIKQMVDRGAELSGNEIAALKAGKKLHK